MKTAVLLLAGLAACAYVRTLIRDLDALLEVLDP